MHKAMRLLRKGLQGPMLSLLADLRALWKLEIKAKAELEMAYWSVENSSQHACGTYRQRLGDSLVQGF